MAQRFSDRLKAAWHLLINYDPVVESDTAHLIQPVTVIRPAALDQKRRTYVVLGVPRGGTSMVAGCLRLLGLPIGDRIESANNEDLDFTETARQLEPLYDDAGKPIAAKFDELRAIASRKATERDVWGWKDPNGHVYIVELLSVLPNPHLIIVFRDLQAAAQTTFARTGQGHLKTIEDTLTQIGFLTTMVRNTDCPVAFVSYERGLRLRESLIRGLADFSGMPIDEKMIDEIITYIRPDRGGGELDEVYRLTDKSFWRGQPIKDPKEGGSDP